MNNNGYKITHISLPNINHSRFLSNYSLLCCLLLTVYMFKDTSINNFSYLVGFKTYACACVCVCVCVCVEEEAGRNGVFNSNCYKSYICKQWWLV